MFTIINLFKQRLKEVYTLPMLFLYALALLLLFVVFISSKTMDIDIAQFMGDMQQLGNLQFYSGIITNLGVFLWVVGGIVNFFTFLVIGKYESNQQANYLLLSCLISFILAIDDFFMFHERWAYRYFSINEKYVLLSYMILIIYYLIAYRAIILKNNFVFLILSLGLFGFSVVADLSWEKVFGKESVHGIANFLVEEGAKFLGLMTWAIYHTISSKDLIIKHLNNNK
ncbi:MAG: hypothetical protein MUE81_05465 [Thermoflexibacter sp.]|jgi:hypothetical protein|nr:hypothetical protein [Thermoflexibacter sp.]